VRTSCISNFVGAICCGILTSRSHAWAYGQDTHACNLWLSNNCTDALSLLASSALKGRDDLLCFVSTTFHVTALWECMRARSPMAYLVFGDALSHIPSQEVLTTRQVIPKPATMLTRLYPYKVGSSHHGFLPISAKNISSYRTQRVSVKKTFTYCSLWKKTPSSTRQVHTIYPLTIIVVARKIAPCSNVSSLGLMTRKGNMKLLLVKPPKQCQLSILLPCCMKYLLHAGSSMLALRHGIHTVCG
jgi:hypothetical protein